MGWEKQIFSPFTRVWPKYKADAQIIALILLVSLVFFWKILLYPGQLIYGAGTSVSDTVNFFYPLYNYAYATLHSGVFPYWNPLILSGYPLAANPQFSLFYPLNSLFLFLPTATAFGISYLLHIFLGGTFMYFLCKHLSLSRVGSFLAAIVFMFGAFVSSHIYVGHYTLVCAAMWFPLLFLFFDLALIKKSLVFGALAGVVLGMQLLTGHIQVTYISLIGLGVYLIYKLFFIIRDKDYKSISKPILIMAVMLTVGIFFAAVKVFPMYAYSIYSTRAGGLSYQDATVYSLTPELLKLLFINPWAGPFRAITGMQNFWEYSSYVGILTLILVVSGIYFSRRNKYVMFFSLLSVVAIILAQGEYTAFYWLLYQILPGFNVFRAPARFIMLFGFAAAILAGFGLDFLRKQLTREQVKVILKGLIILAIISVLIVIITVSVTVKFSAIWISMIILAILIMSSVGIIYLRIKNRLSGKYFNIVAVSFILLDLWFFHMPFVNIKSVADIYQTPMYIVYLQEHAQGYRVFDPEAIMHNNHYMIMGISEINGYDASVLNLYSEFIGNKAGVIGSKGYFTPAPLGITNLGENKISLLNVKYVLSSTPVKNSDFNLVFWDSHVYIYEYLNALPQAFIVHDAEVITSGNDVLARINDSTFDVKKDIILQESPGNISLINPEGIDNVSVEQKTSQEIIINASNATPGFLVLSESWYPCWKAYVDGKPSDIQKTDFTLMSVYLDSGNHKVQFVYEDQPFKVGILVSCVTILTLVIIFGIYIIKKRKTRISK